MKKKVSKKNRKRCPCFSGQDYRDCCRSYHRGGDPPTAEALMRSRYAAYALGLVEYVIDTTHPASPHFQVDTAAWRQDLRHFCQSTDFVGLTILKSEVDQVTFHAQLTQSGRDASFVEHSLFRQEKGRWLYLAAK